MTKKELLEKGLAVKHWSYDSTGIICLRLRKISGSAGIDINFAYMTSENDIEIVSENNVHYGYAHLVDKNVYDNSNRSVFEIIPYESEV